MSQRNLGLWLIIGGFVALFLLNGPWAVGARANWGGGDWHAAHHVSTWQSAGDGSAMDTPR